MDVCRATVVVFSPEAIASPSVQNEVAVLMQRKRRTERFPVLPFLVAGAVRAPLREGIWKATEVAETEMRTWGDGDTVAEILDRLKPLLEQRSATDPDRLLEATLGERLGKLRLATLRIAGECLGLGLEEWELEGDPPGAVAQRLLESQHEDQLTAALLLGQVVDADLADDVYKLVEPSGFLPAETALAIRRCALAPEHSRGIGLNADLPETCELFVRRGHFLWRHYQVPRDWSDAVIADVLANVGDEVAMALGYSPTDLPVDTRLLNAMLATTPVFVVLPDLLQKRGIVEALRAELPNLVLIIRCGSGEHLAQDFAGVEYLVPNLPDGEEERVCKARGEARVRLKGLRPHVALRAPI